MQKRNEALLTVVIPVFNEVHNVAILAGRIALVFNELPHLNYRILFVNDGSTDATYEKLIQISEKNPHIQVLDLSRNFGNQHAISAGLQYAGGDAVITMDADLQHPAEIIKDLVEKWEDGAEVVLTKRTGHSRGLAHRLFFWVLSKLSDVELERSVSDFRLLDRKVVEVLKTFTEKERFFRGMVHWVGFKREYVSYQVEERNAGQSSFSLRKLYRLGIVGFTSFSTFPLRLSLLFGIPIFVGSLLSLIFMSITVFFFNHSYFTPLAFVVVLNAFLSGVILIALAGVAKYLEIVYREVIGRPSYIVRERVNIADSNEIENGRYYPGHPLQSTFV